MSKEEKEVLLPRSPKLVFYEAFLVYDDSSRMPLGRMVGRVGESMIGAAFKRAFLLESDSTKVKRVKIEKI